LIHFYKRFLNNHRQRMDFLKAEIERKKRQISEKNVMQPEKKYFKRGDLVAVQEKEYLGQHGGGLAAASLAKPAAQSNKDGDKKDEVIRDHLYPLSRTEVIRRLREAFQPIILFGESEDEANLRLRSLEIGGDTDRLGGTSQNDYMEAMKRVDKAFLKSIEADKEGDDGEEKNIFEDKVYMTDKTHEDLLSMMLALKPGDLKQSDIVILEWIKVVMTLWSRELFSRNEEDATSVKGRMEAATFNQTRAYVKPLLKMLRKHQLTDDIRDSLSSIVRYVLQRDYILANEKYMEMAIGNAPWPIGVTNAGIHARPGRERIFSKHVAHVLNDESQRKYIQGLKRLMTKAQIYFVTDPSRSVDYIRSDEKAPDN